MIKQTATGLASRSLANPYNDEGFLPLICSPMYSVVDESNYQVFLDNKIQVCLPRNTQCSMSSSQGFYTYSLSDFEEFIKWKSDNLVEKICIDTANGNIPQLHDAIKQAKQIHGDKLIIIAGNVSSVEAFVELAKTGVDYIRVGIGGGGGCNTTSNTGVGQEDLEELIRKCSQVKSCILWPIYDKSLNILFDGNVNDRQQVSKVKIIADGISTYIKQCESKYGFNDNGYAAINKLLFAGADLVMVGKLFAQCYESSGEKRYSGFYSKPVSVPYDITRPNQIQTYFKSSEVVNFENISKPELDKVLEIDPKAAYEISQVKYSGMSTQLEQQKYRTVGEHGDKPWTAEAFGKKSEDFPDTIIKPSEGSVQWIPVRWTLREWLHGSDKQDQSPYLMGWVNSIRSAMAYTNQTKLCGNC